MRRAIDIRHHRTAGDPPTATVTLTFDDRFRRRVKLTDDQGEDFLLDLGEARRLDDGDILALEGGGGITVIAAPEPVIDIQCASPSHAARIAWHLGNRHTPVQILENGAMRIRRDHVLKEMARKLGAVAVERSAPFSPERGAYDDGGARNDHHHDHHHHHDHGGRGA